MCLDVTNSCQLGECRSCPGITKIKENLLQFFDEEDLNEVTFDSWQQTDRCTFLTLIMNADDYVNELCEGLVKLRTHNFLTKEQTSFFKSLETSEMEN